MTDKTKTCKTCVMGKATLMKRLKICMFCTHNPKALGGAVELGRAGISVTDNWKANP